MLLSFYNPILHEPSPELLCIPLVEKHYSAPASLERLPHTLIRTPAMIKKTFQIRTTILQDRRRKQLFMKPAGNLFLFFCRAVMAQTAGADTGVNPSTMLWKCL